MQMTFIPLVFTLNRMMEGNFRSIKVPVNFRFISSPDFENNESISGNNEYNLMVRATDLGGVTADQNITVFVLDDNDQPNLSGGNLNPKLDFDSRRYDCWFGFH